jgi:hypothetical protein
MSAGVSGAALATDVPPSASEGGCPSDGTLVRLVEGLLEEARVRALRAHCDGCAPCASALVELARTLVPDPSAAPEDLLGARYRLLAPVGVGGMGVVQAAFDTQLRRKVAVKRLRESGDDASIERRRARFLREARLLASLSHPNVLTVHDVGGMDGELYVVMELVDGWPMSRLASESGHGWREIVDLYVQAGRGLAAAHALGVVHRDVKPENILVGRTGRVLIGDFGLAGLTEAGVPASPSASAPASLTETGALLGTPAYMAPELHDGAPADARSDQFAFCTSLWESLHGRRPFSGPTAAELVAAMRRGPPRLGRGAVPQAVESVVARGLAADPRERHASMDALLTALARARDRREAPRRMALVAGVLLVAATVAVAAIRSRAPVRPALPTPTSSASEPVVRHAEAPPAAAPLVLGPTAALPHGEQRPAKRRPVSRRRIALVPRDADANLILLLADSAHADRDGASCLATLDRVPADAWPDELATRARRRRASCEMLRGRCGEGQRLFAAVEGADAARAAVLADCPAAALPTVEERLSAIATQADEARYAGNSPRRRLELERLLARQAESLEVRACLRREPGARACDRRLGLLSRAYQVVAESFLVGHDCAAGAVLDVARTEVQLETTAPADGDRALGCRADRTREIFPECRTAAEQAERRCLARLKAPHDVGAAPSEPR